ncbi:MAG: SiaB family protein kinase [Bacillota bacterium]
MFDDDIILGLKEQLNDYGIVLSFTGPFSQGIIEEIGAALKSYLNNDKRSKGQVYKVFSVFIEQTQNVKNYAFNFEDEAKKEKILKSGIMIIGETNGKYFICSGNLIEKEDVADLKERLAELKNTDQKGLKKLYKKRLRADMKKDEGGAGLGLIEMARKATEKIDYNFINKENGYYFYTLTVII